MSQAIEIVAAARILYGFSCLQDAGISENGIKKLTGLIYDGINTELFALRVVRVVGRSMPGIKDKTITLPGKQGAYYVESQLDERILEVKTYLKAQNSTEYAVFYSALKALLNPLNGERELVFNDEPDKRFYGRLSSWIEGYQNDVFSEQTLIFTCSDPFIYGSEQYIRTETSAVLKNQGSQETPLVIIIEGPATFPTVTLGDKWFRYEGTLQQGWELEVDSHLDKYSAKLNGANAIDKMVGELFQLPPGFSTITISSGSINIRFSPGWL